MLMKTLTALFALLALASPAAAKETLTIYTYDSFVADWGPGPKVKEAFEKDCARGFTADGPHADDLALTVRAIAAKHHASQGQQRAIVLALKVAELDELSARTGKVPVLLLDDVSSELDRGRNRRLFELLSRLGGQVFLSTTHPEFILLEEHRRDFHVARGVVTPSGG